MPRPYSFALPSLLAACSANPATAPHGNDIDPAVTAALADPLMADPQLDGRANNGMLRPADEPVRAMIPTGVPDPLRAEALPTIAARSRQVMGAAFAGCSFAVRYSYGWAARLPADLTLASEAQVAEAAGSDTPGCALRLIAFTSTAGPEAMADSYRRAAKTGGYAVNEQRRGPALVLSATRARDGAAFVVSVTAPDGGSAVDLVSNRGR